MTQDAIDILKRFGLFLADEFSGSKSGEWCAPMIGADAATDVVEAIAQLSAPTITQTPLPESVRARDDRQPAPPSLPTSVEQLRERILTSNGDPAHNVDALIAAVRAERAQGELETCICAAVRLDDGRVFYGHRHHNAMQAARKHGFQDRVTQQMQGFITTRGRFVGRIVGLALQQAAGVTSARGSYNGRALFSEDLYLEAHPVSGGQDGSADKTQLVSGRDRAAARNALGVDAPTSEVEVAAPHGVTMDKTPHPGMNEVDPDYGLNQAIPVAAPPAGEVAHSEQALLKGSEPASPPAPPAGIRARILERAFKAANDAPRGLTTEIRAAIDAAACEALKILEERYHAKGYRTPEMLTTLKAELTPPTQEDDQRAMNFRWTVNDVALHSRNERG